jgi:plastocyanin
MSDGKNREGLLLPILIPLGALLVIGLVLFGFSRILLAISHNAATVVALVVAAGIVATAAFVASRQKVTGGSLLSMVGVTAGIAMMMGGVALVAVGPEKKAEGGGEVQVVALAAPPGAAADGFDTDTLAVKADVPIALEFDNQDPNVPHNVVIFDGPDEKAPELFKGELVTGPAKVTYQVDALPAGSYFFHCEVHPATMQGVIDAGEGGGGGGGGGPTLVAQGIAFDTDTVNLPADTPTTLTFENKDANTPHNFAIYEDDSATTPLFQGDIATGPTTVEYKIPAIPAGTYYFQCDVHPTMNGKVVVGEAGGGGGGSGGGSPTEAPSAPPSGTGESATASIAAAGLEFDTSTLSFPANSPVILTFDNQDDVNTTGPHNVSIYTDDTLAESLFKGDLVNGPATVDYQVPALQPGEYYFQCDVHPTMTGTVSVS